MLRCLLYKAETLANNLEILSWNVYPNFNFVDHEIVAFIWIIDVD